LCCASSRITRLHAEWDSEEYTIAVAVHRWGLVDWVDLAGQCRATELYLGPFGKYKVPYTATQGLVGFCVIVVGMLALVTVGTMLWKRKRARH
jgi:hypothetical protein